MPASTVGFAEGEADKGLLCGFGATAGDWVICRGKAAGGGGLMYGRGECAVGKRYEPSYDLEEHVVVLA